VRSETSCCLAEERLGDSLVGKGVERRRLGPLDKDDIGLAESEKREGKDPGAKASAWRGTISRTTLTRERTIIMREECTGQIQHKLKPPPHRSMCR
jgi:hypothetical protein